MPNTYSQVYLQFVFAVQNRASLIQPEWEEDLRKYISGIVTTNKHKLIAVNGTANHMHLFVGYSLHQSIPELMKDVKRSSSLWINSNNLVPGKFNWQEGYGAFSYSRSHISKVANYIMNQKEHHKQLTFREEYIDLLEKFGVEYDAKYILQDVK